MQHDARDLIDYDAYPVATPGPARDAILSRVRMALGARGCAVLKGFLRPNGVAAAVAEADGVADRGHRSYSRTNAYFTADDPSLPESDPRRRFFDRSNAFVPADNFRPGGPLRTIFDSPGFDGFIRECLEVPEDRFFRYADPLADVIVNAAGEGNGFPWHFDTNNFTVTLALQNAERGGAFEYAPMIRDPESENFGEVAKVLDGTSDRVVRLESGAGGPAAVQGTVFAAPGRAVGGADAALCRDLLLRRCAGHGGQCRADAAALRAHPADPPRTRGAAVGRADRLIFPNWQAWLTGC